MKDNITPSFQYVLKYHAIINLSTPMLLVFICFVENDSMMRVFVRSINYSGLASSKVARTNVQRSNGANVLQACANTKAIQRDENSGFKLVGDYVKCGRLEDARLFR
jgi:hypothetical protein